MARGCLFEMEKNLENVRTASESSFYDLAEHEFAFIQTCTEDKRKEYIRQFLEYMEKIGIETGTMVLSRKLNDALSSRLFYAHFDSHRDISHFKSSCFCELFF